MPNPAQTQPGGPAPGPQVIAPPEHPHKRSYAWIWVIALGIAAGGGYWLWQKRGAEQAAANVVTTRTAAAQKGKLQKTLRISGSTGAEKYVSLIAPSMRGGRGGQSTTVLMAGMGGRGGGQVTVQASSGGSSNSSQNRSTTTATSSLASTSMSGGNMVASTAGGGGSGGGSSVSGDTVSSSAGASGSNMRSARAVSGGASRTTSSPSRTTSTRSSVTQSASAGSDGMGSTASQLPGGGGGGNSGGGGGGGGRGGNDFMMQLQTLAPNGVRVKKGEPVAEFDRQYMLLRLDDYKATADQAENSMRASLANLEVTRKSYQQQILAAKNLVEKAELDLKTIPVRGRIDAEKLQLALEEAKANFKQLQEAAKYVDIGERASMKVSQLELDTSKLELRRAQANADRMLLKAPMDGLVVVQNNFRGGEMVPITQGDQVFPGQMFMQIVEPNSMVVNANVNQVDVQKLRLGDKARIRFDAFPGLEVPGHVIMIGAITKTAGMRASFKKDVTVRLRLDAMDPRIIPDLSVSADVVLDEEADAVTVPAEAIMADSHDDAKTFVMVRDASGNWQRRDVTVGLTSFTHAAVRNGLKPGDVVALEPPVATKPGDKPAQT